MARKKKFAEVTEKLPEEKFSESYLSIGLGLLVVLVVGVLLFNFFTRNKNQTNTNEGEVAQEATTSGQIGGTHTVDEGETLWDIAENYYDSGFAWENIASANNLADPSNIETGQKLSIPEVKKEEVLSENDLMQQEEQILPETGVSEQLYIVRKGDSLWNIACSEYNDCYRWSDIAQVNNLSEPELIHPGNELQLP